MPILALIMALFIATSCGGFKLFDVGSLSKERTIASMAASHLLIEEDQAFTAEVDEKLKSINSYYLIAHKNLLLFDESITERALEELYESGPYLYILAVKTQVDEIENEIAELHRASKIKRQHKKSLIIEKRIRLFAALSPLKNLAMSNLAQRIGISVNPELDISWKEIEKEYAELEATKEFQIYEKNIEHLSHLIEMRIRSKIKKFRPASTDEGNITGAEFPAKVWALTFDNGPTDTTTVDILKHLKAKKLKATFFQLAIKSQDNKTGRQLLDAGMEIGSNSHSYKELSKVGQLTLEREITESTSKLEKSLKMDIKFFRLPFGSGVNVPTIRQTIAKNNLIHVNWNVDTLDWMAQSPDKIIARTKRLMKKTQKDSGIILFHDVHDRSVKASEKIMDHLKLDGRRSCTIGKIVKEMNEGIDTVCLKN